MQYWQRRLQRSVTQIRKLRSGRSSLSIGFICSLYIPFGFIANESEINPKVLDKTGLPVDAPLAFFRRGTGRHGHVSPDFLEGGGGVGRRGWNGLLRSFKVPRRDARAQHLSHYRNPQHVPLLLGLVRSDHPHARRQSEERDARGCARRRRSRSSDQPWDTLSQGDRAQG